MNAQKPAANAIAPTSQAARSKDPVQTVYALLASQKQQIANALPKHLTADRMLRIVLTELRKNPKLGLCDQLSVMGAVVVAAQLGLEPGGSLGHCYLIPYGKECQLQIGYRGQVDLARRSGNILSIEARCVFEGDEFQVELGTESSITHRPAFKSSVATHVYAVAKLKGGGVQFDVMSIAEVNYIRDTYSQAHKRDPEGGPWATAPEEMAKKTVVRRLFKMLPTSIEIREAMALDDDEAQHNAKAIDATWEVVPDRHDPSVMKAELAADSVGESIPTQDDKKNAEADRANALAELDKGIKHAMTLGAIPANVIGSTVADMRKKDVSDIYLAADLLLAVGTNK
jgi:recombination protein RecT